MKLNPDLARAAEELEAYSRAAHPHLYAQPGPRRHSPVAARPQVLRASRAFGQLPKRAPRPAPRQETHAEKLARLNASVRAGVPGVLAKASSDFTLGKLTALDVSRIEAQCHRLLEATS